MKKPYESVTTKPIGKSQLEITGSIATETWQGYRAQALKELNERVSLDGFRKGMVPENVLVAKAGEITVLEEMAELALSSAYIDIIMQEKIDAIGKPEIQITKLAKDNPLEFKIVTAIVPAVVLPDYQKLAAAEVKKTAGDETKVSESDIDEAVLRVRKSRASHEGHDHEKLSPEEHDKAIMASLPELTDDFVKSLGDFNDIPDFRNKLSVMIAEEKQDAAKEKRRLKIADAIEEATKAELPDIMIDSELDRTEAQFRADIERMGVSLEDYLKHAKKTLPELRDEWKPHAIKKAKLQLILNAIAEKESLKADKKEIDAEADLIIQHYKDADRERAVAYAETVLTNEKVFQWLERQ